MAEEGELVGGPSRSSFGKIVSETKGRYLILTSTDFNHDYDEQLQRESLRSLVNQKPGYFHEGRFYRTGWNNLPDRYSELTRILIKSESTAIEPGSDANNHALSPRDLYAADNRIRLRAKHLWILFAILALSVVHISCLTMNRSRLGTYHDDGIYVTTAKAIATGQGYRIVSLPFEPSETKYPPLHPFLLSVIWRLKFQLSPKSNSDDLVVNCGEHRISRFILEIPHHQWLCLCLTEQYCRFSGRSEHVDDCILHKRDNRDALCHVVRSRFVSRRETGST
jgi:hypothetical protein